MRAIILAGGLGTRLRPLTYDTPKPLLPIKDKPLIEWAILNLKKHGITDIILSIGYKSEMIKDYFKSGEELGVDISYNVEEEFLGTGGAIKEASMTFKEPFIALNGDNLADFDFNKQFELHKNNNAKITLALVSVEDVTKFGIVELEGDKILQFVEKPSVEEAPSKLCNAGAYIIESGVLDMLPEGKSSIEKQCFEVLASKDVIFGYKHEGQWFPTDDIEKYNKAEKEWKRQ